MRIPIYQNVELTSLIGYCDVGETSPELYRPNSTLGAHYNVIDDVKYFSTWGFNSAPTKTKPEATFVRPTRQTSGSNTATLYINERFRIHYRWNPSVYATFAIRGVELKNNNGTWISVAQSEYLPSIDISDRYLEGIGFYYGAFCIDYGDAQNRFKGEGYFLALRTRGTSSGDTSTIVSMFMSENFFESVSGKRKRTRNERKGGGASGTIARGAVPEVPYSQINSILMAYSQGNGYGLTYYRLFGNALAQITARMYPRISLFQSAIAARRAAFVSVVAIPYDVPSSATSHNTVYLADATITIDGDASANWVNELIIKASMGEFDFANELQNDFTDISYTEYTLYLPGYGTVSIEPSACAQGSVFVDAYLDVRNGNVVYQVTTIADGDDGPTLWGHYPANIAVKIPISGNSSMGDALGLITNIGKSAAGALEVGVGIAAGNPTQVVSSGSKAVESAGKAAEQVIPSPHISNRHILDSNVSGICSCGVCMMITQNRVLYARGYTSLDGRTSVGSTAYDEADEETLQTLSNFHESNQLDYFSARFVRVDAVIGLTDDEKEELRSLLRGGVWL